jgi:PAS domain S-box-containing protein
MVPEEVRPLVNQVWEDVLHQRGGTRSTNENFTKDGRAIMCEWYNAPLVDAEGNTLGVASLVSDITARVEAERAMQRTRASVENAESAFFWFDVDTNFTDVSDRTCEMLGYPREQLLEMRVFDIDPVFPEEAWPGLREQVKETGSVTLESRHRTQQGREFPVQVTVSYLEFGGEDIYFAVAQDITERQQAEEERERFTTRLETAAEISEQTGAILDPDELLQTVIPLIKERFGLYYVHVYTLDEESGMLNLRAGYGEAGETMLAEGHAIPVGREASLVARAARTKEPVMVDDVTDNPNFMPNPLLPDTKTEVAVPAIAGGQVLGVFDVQHDQAQYFTEADLDVFLTLAGQIANTFHSASLLGEQQRAEAAMRQERDFADTAINSLPGIFYMYNMQSQLVRWNQNFPDVLGYSEDELVQMSVTDFIPEPDRELISSKMQQVFTEGATTVESAVLTKDGEVIPYYFTGIRAQVEGESYLVGVGIDITDRKQAEEAIRESERQLSAAMQLADMATWEFDVPTQTFLFNDNYYETFADATAEEVGGYEMTAEEFAQRFVPPIDAGKVGENIQQALETDDPDFQLQMESRNLTLDGEQRWTSVWFRVEKDEEGRTTKLHGVNQDITERKQTEAERARLTTIMDSTSDLVSISTPEGKLEYMNEAGREMLGWADEESIADRDITEVYPEWALEIAGNVGLPTAIEKGIWQGEAAILGPDGSEVPVSQVIMAHRSPDSGDLEYISTIMRDITERVRAERQIRESEQRLSLLVEQSPLAVIEWNTDFEVASWNPAAEEIFGYTEEEAMGRHAAGLMVPEEVRPLVNQVWEDVLHQQGGTRSTNENFTKEGRTIMCEWYNAPMVDQDGNTLGVASLVSDITARVEAEQARERFTEQLRTAADLAEDISAILDPDRLLNRVVDELQSRFNLYHVHVYLTGDDRNELIMQAGSGEVGQQMLAEGHTIPWDEAQSLVARAARTKKIVSVSNTKKETGFLPNPLLPETRSEVAIPLVAGEKVLGVLDVQDSQVERFSESDLDIFSTLAGQIAIALQNADFVEELNETAERLREVDRLKSEFLASMSHELRTPLNSIIGYTEIMLMGIDQELSEETMEDVQAIYDNSQQLLAIINDVLDLARIEAGRLEMEMNEVNVTDVINAAQKSAEGLLVDDVIDFIVEAEEDLPTIWGDQRRIDQILNNLVSNAIKFTEEGHVALRAYADDHTVCLAVEDTGVGIAEEDQDRIFERFEQLNQTVTKQRQGTGLGLAITRELVELHGGTLEVESELGTGSTFTIRLPVKQA